MLPHLRNGWEVDQAILTEEDRVVVVRFGRDQDPTCMVQDEVLMSIADKVKNFAVVYLVSRRICDKFRAVVFWTCALPNLFYGCYGPVG